MEAKLKRYWPLIIIACVFAAFWPTLSNGFTNWDDQLYITENPAIRSVAPANIWNILSSTHRGLYKPLVFLSYAVEYHFFQLNPFIYHFDNLLLHAANAVLVCLILQQLGAELFTALLGALLFGIHPLRVESVAWLAERKDMLYSFFLLASMLAYLKYRNSSLARYNAFSVLLFILSLMSKAAGVILPVLLLLFDWRQNRKLDRKMLLDKLPHLGAALVFAAFNMFMLNRHDQIGGISPETVFFNIPIAAYSLLLYIGKIALPISQSVMYPYPDTPPFFLPQYIAAPFLILALALLAWHYLKSDRRLMFGPAFFAAALLPFLQWVPIQPGIAMEHLTYIPSIGLAYFAAELILRAKNKISARAGKTALMAALALVLLALGGATFARCKVWENSVTLWADRLEKYPSSNLAYINLSAAYAERGELQKAREAADMAVAAVPYGKSAALARRANTLYKIQQLWQASDYDNSLKDINQALSLMSNIVLRPDTMEFIPSMYCLKGAIYRAKGDNRLAFLNYKAALALDAQSWTARIGLGELLFEAGNIDAAETLYLQVVEKNPIIAEGYNGLGTALAAKGRYREAIILFDRALELSRGDSGIYVNKAVAYMRWGQPKKALENIAKARQLGGAVNPDLVKELYAKLGKRV